MKDGESLFSFIKKAPGQDEPGHAEQHPPFAPSGNFTQPPPRPAEDWSGKIAELERKLKALETKGQETESAALNAVKADLQASQLRVAELEREAVELKGGFEAFKGAAEEQRNIFEKAGKAKQAELEAGVMASHRRSSELERTVSLLKKVIEDAVAKKLSGNEAAGLEVEKLRGQIAVLGSRADSLEALGRGLSQANLDGSLYERCMKNIEAGIVGEFKERFSVLDSNMERISRKANLAQETVAGSAERIEKLEERTAQVAYLKTRLEGSEHKFEKFYELEALVQALKVTVESVENKFLGVVQETSGMAEEHKIIRSDFESVSRQLNQLSALFNHFRTELSFLLPKTKAGSDEKH